MNIKKIIRRLLGDNIIDRLPNMVANWINPGINLYVLLTDNAFRSIDGVTSQSLKTVDLHPPEGSSYSPVRMLSMMSFYNHRNLIAQIPLREVVAVSSEKPQIK